MTTHRKLLPIIPKDRYFWTRCEHCGWFGSSEQALVYANEDDADCGCPSCYRVFLCDPVDPAVAAPAALMDAVALCIALAPIGGLHVGIKITEATP